MKRLRHILFACLQPLQRLFRTDMHYVVTNGFWLTSKELVVAIASFILSLFFANYLAAETFGKFSYVLSVINILLIPTLTGMTDSLAQAVARNYDGTILPATKTRIRWGLLGSLGCLGVAGYSYLTGDLLFTLVFLISAVFIPLLDAFRLYTAFLTGKRDFKRLAIALMCSKLTYALVMIAVILVSGTLIAITMTYLIITTVLMLFFFLQTRKHYSFAKPSDGSAIGYGKHLSLMNALITLSSHIDQVIVFHILGPVKLAIYLFATKPPKLVRSFLQNIQTLALPKIAANSIATVRKTLPKKIFLFNALLLPVVLAYVLLAQPFFSFFFPQYLESVRYSQLFAIMLLLFPRSIFATALLALKQKKFLYYARISHAVVKIILLACLPLFYGIYGAVAAILISDAFNYAVVYLLFRRLKTTPTETTP